MNSVIDYILKMIPYMISTSIIIIIIIYLKNKNNNIQNYNHDIVLIIFSMFLAGLLSQAIIPNADIRFRIDKINIVPFKIILDIYNECEKGNINYLIINFFGNILMFIPIGFFTMLLWNIPYWKAVLFGFSISFFIETSQLFINRNTDIDDLILNVFGVLIGIYIYKILYKKYKNRLNQFKS